MWKSSCFRPGWVNRKVSAENVNQKGVNKRKYYPGTSFGSCEWNQGRRAHFDGETCNCRSKMGHKPLLYKLLSQIQKKLWEVSFGSVVPGLRVAWWLRMWIVPKHQVGSRVYHSEFWCMYLIFPSHVFLLLPTLVFPIHVSIYNTFHFHSFILSVVFFRNYLIIRLRCRLLHLLEFCCSATPTMTSSKR